MNRTGKFVDVALPVAWALHLGIVHFKTTFAPMLRFCMVATGLLAACGDNATIETSTPDALEAQLDACIETTDAEPASECCVLEGEAAGECAKAQAAPGTCVAIACFHGCEITKIHGCNL